MTGELQMVGFGLVLVMAEGIRDSEESELCLPFLGWMTQQLSYSQWGRVGGQDSQIAFPLAGVWIHNWVTVRPVSGFGVVWVHG